MTVDQSVVWSADELAAFQKAADTFFSARNEGEDFLNGFLIQS